MAVIGIQRTYVCSEPTCAYYGRGRLVTWPLVAPGLYLTGDVVCTCGHPCSEDSVTT